MWTACVLALVAARGLALAEADEQPGTWRFTEGERPIKVVVLAGSIGAWQRNPYASEIERRCRNVEVKNISKAGLGAWALKKRFEAQVLDNRRLDLEADGQEFWLVYGGGLNTVWDPNRNNHQAKNTFVKAHMAGMKVLGLTVTPWGSDGDKRFRGARAVESRKATQKIVDFVMGRLSPAEALGSYASRRPAGVDGPWNPIELPDLSVDLYDSPMRDASATVDDVDKAANMLDRDAAWARAHRKDADRELALSRDAEIYATRRQWYLRPELHSFDHIHPNADGHHLIGTIVCPHLPQNWGCACDPVPGAATAEPDADIVPGTSAQDQSGESTQHPRSLPPRFPNLRGCLRQ